MNATNLQVTDVELTLDTMECGYRIVELESGEHAFVWGNIRAKIGDILPADPIGDPTANRGISIHPTYEDAKRAWRDCGEALQQTGIAAGDEMLNLDKTTSGEKVQIQNLHNDFATWVPNEVIERAVECNPGGIALMVEDWPEGTTDENNAWRIVS